MNPDGVEDYTTSVANGDSARKRVASGRTPAQRPLVTMAGRPANESSQ